MPLIASGLRMCSSRRAVLVGEPRRSVAAQIPAAGTARASSRWILALARDDRSQARTAGRARRGRLARTWLARALLAALFAVSPRARSQSGPDDSASAPRALDSSADAAAQRGPSSPRAERGSERGATPIPDPAPPPPPGDAQFGEGTWLGDEGVWDSESAPPPADDGSAGGAEPAWADDGRGLRNGTYASYPEDISDYPAESDDQDAAGAQDGQTAGPTIDDFHSALDGAGEWIETPEYGLVWRPDQVDSNWRPYTDGQWNYTDAGWTWSGAETWAWAVYHYGRWVFANGAWSWVPGRVWGPAWVAWRWGARYAGWAPLGPRGTVWASPACWVVIEQSRFLEPVRGSVEPLVVAQTFVQRTRVYPIRRPGPRAGPAVRAVASAVGASVPLLHLRPVRSPAQASARGPSLNVYRPQTKPIVGVPSIRAHAARPEASAARARAETAAHAPARDADAASAWPERARPLREVDSADQARREECPPALEAPRSDEAARPTDESVSESAVARAAPAGEPRPSQRGAPGRPAGKPVAKPPAAAKAK